MALFEFSEYVRNHAEIQGLSMAELARQVGISRQALYGVLDGSTGQAKVSTIIALAFALKVHPLSLFRQLLHKFDMPQIETPGAKHQYDASGFVRDVTIPDNSRIACGQVFTKTWEIQNIGDVEWRNRQLVCMDLPFNFPAILPGIALPSSSTLLVPHKTHIQIPNAKSTDKVTLSVEFTAPNYPCSVVSYWKMVDEHGDICFPNTEGLWCMVQVVSL